MTTIESVLRRSIEGRDDERILTLDPAFQGLPDTAHGGSVLAAFDAIATSSGPREVAGLYRKRVPLGVPLTLRLAPVDATLTCRLLDESASVLVEGRVSPAMLAKEPPRHAATGPGHPLPISSSCFACGVDNALGLRARLAFDDDAVGGTWRPSDAFRLSDGSLAPVALTSLLDETAFWLGALATGESGMTTDLRVTLHRPVPFGASITVWGARAGVKQKADDPRYCEAEVVALDDRGVVATGQITFVAVRGAARRLVQWLLTTNPPEVLGRVFPEYAR